MQYAFPSGQPGHFIGSNETLFVDMYGELFNKLMIGMPEAGVSNTDHIKNNFEKIKKNLDGMSPSLKAEVKGMMDSLKVADDVGDNIGDNIGDIIGGFENSAYRHLCKKLGLPIMIGNSVDAYHTYIASNLKGVKDIKRSDLNTIDKSIAQLLEPHVKEARR